MFAATRKLSSSGYFLFYKELNPGFAKSAVISPKWKTLSPDKKAAYNQQAALLTPQFITGAALYAKAGNPGKFTALPQIERNEWAAKANALSKKAMTKKPKATGVGLFGASKTFSGLADYQKGWKEADRDYWRKKASEINAGANSSFAQYLKIHGYGSAVGYGKLSDSEKKSFEPTAAQKKAYADWASTSKIGKEKALYAAKLSKEKAKAATLKATQAANKAKKSAADIKAKRSAAAKAKVAKAAKAVKAAKAKAKARAAKAKAKAKAAKAAKDAKAKAAKDAKKSTATAKTAASKNADAAANLEKAAAAAKKSAAKVKAAAEAKANAKPKTAAKPAVKKPAVKKPTAAAKKAAAETVTQKRVAKFPSTPVKFADVSKAPKDPKKAAKTPIAKKGGPKPPNGKKIVLATKSSALEPMVKK